ncbi:DUF6985 domain-containing protein [Sulfidibacter corallicola]
MPDFQSSIEIPALVNLNYITVSWPYGGSSLIGLSYTCDWAEEHGLGA